MSRVSHAVDSVRVSFDASNMVANAGLLLVGTLVVRLELERLVNATVRLSGRVGGARPGRNVLTLVHAMVAGASHIDHADVLRSGGSQPVLPFRAMALPLARSCAPSASAMFVSWKPWWATPWGGRGPWVAARVRPGWSSTSTRRCVRWWARPSRAPPSATPRCSATTPILGARADTGEVCHARMRKGSANTAGAPGASSTCCGPTAPGRISR